MARARLHRRRVAALFALVVLAPALSPAVRAVELKSIAVLGFGLIDDRHDLAPATVEYQRLPVIRKQLAGELERHGLYRVVDIAPAEALIAKLSAQAPLDACNGCELAVAQALHADRVLVGWVQKVSNLILNINIRIEDAGTGKVVLERSVDLRGDTDASWSRGIRYLVQQMVDAHEGNR